MTLIGGIARLLFASLVIKLLDMVLSMSNHSFSEGKKPFGQPLNKRK